MNYNELIDLSYKNLMISLIGLFANSTALLVIFYKYTNTRYLIIWYIVIIGLSSIRYISLYKFTNKKYLFVMKTWKTIFTIGVILSATTWGIVPIIFFPHNNPMLQVVIVIIIAGLSAGAITSLSFILLNVRLFLIITITPLIIQLLIQNTYIYDSVAGLIFLYLILMLHVAKKFHKNYINILKAKLLYKNEQKKLSKSEQKFKTIFESVPIGIIFYDDKLIIREINQEFINFLEAPRDFLIGFDMNNINDTRILPACQAPFNNIKGYYEGEYQTKYANKKIWIIMNTSPLKDTENNIIGGIGIVNDITQRVLIQQRIEHQAHYDALTDIPNRFMLQKHIKREIDRYKRHNIIFAVVFLDLDYFKNINDSLGHTIGDELLIQITFRIQNIIRSEDTIARIGGDEFVVLLPDLSKNNSIAATKTEKIVQKIQKSITRPFILKDHTLNITASIGIALMRSQHTAEDLLKYADIAMYAAKKDGRNTIRFYQDKMDQWIKRRLKVENLLRHAIKNNELEIFFQPIVEFSTSNIIGMEALLRWNSKGLGAVFPDEFIPIAEESGIILTIGEWVLQHGVKQFVLWQKQFPHITTLKKIAINVSVHQFNNINFLEQVSNVLKNNKINPSHLELELVESIIVNDVATIRAKMQKLRELGIGISIDDFGTGYSSLSYLKQLPFTTLKIDKSFTQDIQKNIDDQELIDTILMIADKFNLEVVAEGVETDEQYHFLNKRKCDYLQGYYCSKPMDVSTFTDMLQKNQGKCHMKPFKEIL